MDLYKTIEGELYLQYKDLKHKWQCLSCLSYLNHGSRGFPASFVGLLDFK